MKRLTILTGFLSLVLSVTAYAQSKTGADFFAGKWDSTGKEISKCSKIEVKDNEATLYYTALGNDVSIVLTKKDEDHVTGRAMGMFDAKGERIKQLLQ